jgi:cytochrome bd-type quinol oxidase subunit 2
MTWMSFDEALPVIFMALMGLAMLVYVISDGYDLGVGMLMHRATPDEKDVMVASIGPFWDANETWLVLGIGILLVAFPKAHGLPVALMLIGLILRGVAFDFRVKAHAARKPMWDRAFFTGSMLAALAQGWMLGRYISGFGSGWNYPVFAAAIAVTLPMAYVLLGACWLPFVLLIVVFVLSFLGLAYSIYPYVVIDRLTVWQAASSAAALKFILVGVCISVPAIAGYTVFSYRVFRGKTGELRYA